MMRILGCNSCYQHQKRSLSGGCGEFRLGSSNLPGIRKQSSVSSTLGLQLHREINFIVWNSNIYFTFYLIKIYAKTYFWSWFMEMISWHHSLKNPRFNSSHMSLWGSLGAPSCLEAVPTLEFPWLLMSPGPASLPLSSLDTLTGNASFLLSFRASFILSLPRDLI